ncbi:DNA-directed RNA polymerase subunit beta [Evansella halocellulosilytica]|uniref:DNA-directed RNA polymerase subunit beta n=1 Tax=Evansella halocellulosilytica TaxID=2011013 RepID=UPI00211BEDFC|nr:DNA-directed RNA polymerase subunit beta [Evansella halocellulosilytica]
MNKENEFQREDHSSPIENEKTENNDELKHKQSEVDSFQDNVDDADYKNSADSVSEETAVFSLGEKKSSKENDREVNDEVAVISSADVKQSQDEIEAINPIPPDNLLVTEEEDRRSEMAEDDGEQNRGMTRKELKQEKAEQKEKAVKPKRGRIRLIPIWLRVIIILILLVASLIGGAMFGYGVIGDGEPRDVLDRDPWYHIYDIIFEDTDRERTR